MPPPPKDAPPKVSVVVPNYRYAHFLPERIDSILNQTIRDMEIIFLDDASGDESVAVFQKLTNGSPVPTRIEVNQTNSGSAFKQWNKGAALARGKYIWIAEADDSCSPLFLERVLPFLETDPRVSMAYAQSRPVDEHGAPVGGQMDYLAYTDPLDPRKWKQDYVNKGKNEVLDHLLIMNTIPNVSAVVLRRTAYAGAGGAPEDFRLAGDWMLYLALFKTGDIGFCSEVLNLHRRHSATITSNTVTDLTYFRELVRVQDYLKRNYPLQREHHKRLREKILRDWSHLANGPFGKISKPNLLRLLLIAIRHDPSGAARFANMLLRTLCGR